MPYCKHCGTKNDEDARFCLKCGASLYAAGGVVYRRNTSWQVGRVLSLVIGALILLIALGLVVGGGALIWSLSTLTDTSGYMVSNPMPLSVDSYAIVQNGVNVHIPSMVWAPASRNVVSIRISATSNNGKPVFIGIAPQQSAVAYFSGVDIDRLVSYDWTPSSLPSRGSPAYVNIPGGALSTPPTSQVFWVAQVSGAGTQTVTWTPTQGDYWVVLMNADGSKTVDASVQVGVRVTILSYVGWALLVGGLLTAFVGFVVIYFGAVPRPRPREPF